MDVANVRPLHEVLGPAWEREDMMRVFEPEVRARLLVEEVRTQRGALTAALNAVTKALMPRRRLPGAYTLAEMRTFYQGRHVACVGEDSRMLLDMLFADSEPRTPETARLHAPVYDYPVMTFSGIAYCEPVTDYDAGRRCERCKYWAACHEIVTQRDGLALCEMVLESEVLPEAVCG